MALEIDHDGAAAAAVFYAVIDKIPEDTLQPQFAAPDRKLASPPIMQPVLQGYLVVLDFSGQFSQDRFDNINGKVQEIFCLVLQAGARPRIYR